MSIGSDSHLQVGAHAQIETFGRISVPEGSTAFISSGPSQRN
jgi:hypothetical protein